MSSHSWSLAEAIQCYKYRYNLREVSTALVSTAFWQRLSSRAMLFHCLVLLHTNNVGMRRKRHREKEEIPVWEKIACIKDAVCISVHMNKPKLAFGYAIYVAACDER